MEVEIFFDNAVYPTIEVKSCKVNRLGLVELSILNKKTKCVETYEFDINIFTSIKKSKTAIGELNRAFNGLGYSMHVEEVNEEINNG